GHQQGLARAHRKAQAVEDLTAAPDAGDIGGDEPHQPTARARRDPMWARQQRIRTLPFAPRAGVSIAFPIGPEQRGNPHFMVISPIFIDYLNPRKKRPYKPIRPRSLPTRAAPRRSTRPIDTEALPVIPYRRAADRRLDGNRST